MIETQVHIFILGYCFIGRVMVGGLSSDCDKAQSAVRDLYARSMHDGFMGLVGNYNVICINEAEQNLKVITSPLGLIPLYKFVDSGSFVLADRLTDIKSRFCIELDLCTVAQMSLYNYPISDLSLLKNVRTIEPGCMLSYDCGNVVVRKYWQPEDLLNRDILSLPESFEIIDEALRRSIKRYSENSEKVATSLTGGWDGRLVLAYLLNFKDDQDILSYSFGTKDAPDVKIPLHITQDLGLEYLPILLDERYLRERYLDVAKQTILNSEAYRSMQRAHYLYAMKLISASTKTVITGICGSNLMKSAATTPSVVFNRRIIELLSADDPEAVLVKHFSEFERAKPSVLGSVSSNDFCDAILSPLMKRTLEISDYKGKASCFILNYLERKYFGYEMVSYSSHVTNLSPFTDIDFIGALSQTPYYNAAKTAKTIFSNWQNGILYAKLIHKNYPTLASYNSDKGVSLSDLLKPWKYPLLAMIQYKRRNQGHQINLNYYNTGDTLSRFCQEFNCQDLLPQGEYDKNFWAPIVSTLSWIDMVAKENYESY
jgi:hypothetical protein